MHLCMCVYREYSLIHREVSLENELEDVLSSSHAKKT